MNVLTSLKSDICIAKRSKWKFDCNRYVENAIQLK